MDLRTGEPYWLMKNGYCHSYPALTGDLQTEVCVLGGGITGALAAYALAKEGVEVTVIDKRHPGMGSTSASTALLQYEIDEPLHTLIDKVGRRRAEASYTACYHAIDAIGAIIREENLMVDFLKSPSLQYASKPSHARDLKKEYEARMAIGLDVALLPGGEVEELYGIGAPAGLLSSQGAQVDVYQLAHALLNLPLDNLRVFDTTEVEEVRPRRRGVELRLKGGGRVRAWRLVICCGYESQRFLSRQVVEMATTYAIVTKPVDVRYLWPDRTLLWETKTPYLYLRTTEDDRIIAGGRDDEGHSRRHRNAALDKKAARIVQDVHRLRPDIPFQPDFIWAGAFGGTEDSLPYVGQVAEMDNTYFILGFGGNGIVFSQTGSEIVRDAILQRKNANADLYSFDR